MSLVLTAAGFIGSVVAAILEFSGDLPQFPCWQMMAFSIGAVLLLMGSYVLIGIFSPTVRFGPFCVPSPHDGSFGPIAVLLPDAARLSCTQNT